MLINQLEAAQVTIVESVFVRLIRLDLVFRKPGKDHFHRQDSSKQVKV